MGAWRPAADLPGRGIGTSKAVRSCATTTNPSKPHVGHRPAIFCHSSYKLHTHAAIRWRGDARRRDTGLMCMPILDAHTHLSGSESGENPDNIIQTLDACG